MVDLACFAKDFDVFQDSAQSSLQRMESGAATDACEAVVFTPVVE